MTMYSAGIHSSFFFLDVDQFVLECSLTHPTLTSFPRNTVLQMKLSSLTHQQSSQGNTCYWSHQDTPADLTELPPTVKMSTIYYRLEVYVYCGTEKKCGLRFVQKLDT